MYSPSYLDSLQKNDAYTFRNYQHMARIHRLPCLDVIYHGISPKYPNKIARRVQTDV